MTRRWRDLRSPEWRRATALLIAFGALAVVSGVLPSVGLGLRPSHTPAGILSYCVLVLHPLPGVLGIALFISRPRRRALALIAASLVLSGYLALFFMLATLAPILVPAAGFWLLVLIQAKESLPKRRETGA